MTAADETRLTRSETLEALVRSEALVAIVDRLPVHHHRDGGRPRNNSVFSLVLMHLIVTNLFDSRVREAIKELHDPMLWQYLSDLVRSVYPNRPDFWLGAKPIKRSAYLYFRDTYIIDDVGLDVYRDEGETVAIDGCAELGLCQEDAAGSWTNPSRNRTMQFDGTVVRPASTQIDGELDVDEDTGEILKRHRGDPDIRSHREGGKPDAVFGHKLLFASTRGDRWMQRVILAVDYVDVGGEMATAEAMFDRILPRLPGTQLGIADGAMRGKTIEYLQRRHGVIGMAPNVAKRGRKNRGERQQPKEAFLETVFAVDPVTNMQTQLDIWVTGGTPCTLTFNERGDRVFEPLELVQVHRRGSFGQYRFHLRYRTRSGLELWLRALPTDEDRQRNFNRCENFRIFSAATTQYLELYGRRSDAESVHRQYKDALWLRRANVYRWRRVLSNGRAYAIGQNAIALYLHRRSAEQAQAA